MSIQDAARAALAQWEGRTVDGMDLPTVMVAIAGAESSWQNDAPGDALGSSPVNCRGFESWGLWQIHLPAHKDTLKAFTHTTDPCYWAQWLSDPDNAARAADAVIRGTGQHLPASALVPWTVWWSRDGGQTDTGDGNGRYLDFMDRAAEAVATERGGGFPLPPPAGDDEESPGAPAPPGGSTIITLPPSSPLKAGTIRAGAVGLAAIAGLLVGAWLLVGQDQ